MVERKKRKTKTQKTIDQVKKIIESPKKEKIGLLEDLVSTGSTMLNLALSDTPYGGYALGTVIHVIGDTHAGKSLLALSLMAEASISNRLIKHALIYEEPESAMFFPIKERFGKEAYKRIKFIPTQEERAKGARTVQKWHNDLLAHVVPFIWITDSFDALTSDEDLKTTKADGKTKTLGKGGFRIEKPIVAKQLFPKIVSRIEASKSLFMWISQTIDNIGVSFGPTKAHAGGSAIKFFRAYEIWLAVVSRIYKRVRGKDREVGAWVRVRIKKNKFIAKMREIDIAVYPDHGIDDIGSIINWLVQEGYWEREKVEGKKTASGPLTLTTKIRTEDSFVDGTFLDVIKHIEDNDLEEKLKEVVAECWLDLQKEITIERKARY